jgi:hypothetical protein
VIEENERGKKVPRKVGMKPEQREGIEYEFDVVADLDYDNTLTVTKTRIPALAQAVIPKPGPDVADTIREWLEQGDDTPDALAYRDRARELTGLDELKALYAEVKATGLLGAPILDGDGNPTVLGEYIVSLGNKVRAAQ